MSQVIGPSTSSVLSTVHYLAVALQDFREDWSLKPTWKCEGLNLGTFPQPLSSSHSRTLGLNGDGQHAALQMLEFSSHNPQLLPILTVEGGR